MTTQLDTIAKSNSLAESDPLVDALGKIEAAAARLVTETKRITVTALDQVAEMGQAREARIKLKNLRTATERARVAYKAEFLAKGRTVDALANWVKDQIEPEERRLLECEEFALRAEAKRKEELKAARGVELGQYGADPQFFDLANMPEEAYAALLRSTRLAHEQKAEEARTAEEARKAEAAMQAEMRAIEEEEARRVRAENERLRKEKMALEGKARREREAQEKALAEERRKREMVEAQAHKERAEAAAKKAAEAEEGRRLAMAPDVEKVKAYVLAIMNVPTPVVETVPARMVVKDLVADINHYMERAEKL